MDITQASIIVGAFFTLATVLLTVVYQKRFDPTDLGSFLGVFFSGSNIPPAIFLIVYPFTTGAVAALASTQLSGYEKYISLAGLCLALVSFLALWKFIKAAVTVTPTASEEAVPEARQPVLEPSSLARVTESPRTVDGELSTLRREGDIDPAAHPPVHKRSLDKGGA